MANATASERPVGADWPGDSRQVALMGWGWFLEAPTAFRRQLQQHRRERLRAQAVEAAARRARTLKKLRLAKEAREKRKAATGAKSGALYSL